MSMSTEKSTAAASECTPEQLSALAMLKSHKRFILTGHVRPDGDCVGAQAALASCLEHMGCEVTVLNPDPIETRYEYLARHVKYHSWDGGALPAHDVVVFLDFNEITRCGRLGEAFAKARSKKLVIDHHISDGAAWWDEAFVDVHASATGLLVHRIHEAIGVEVDLPAAEGIYTSIVSDTGWFKYSNTDAETLRIASEMVEIGVEPSRMFQAIEQRKRPNHPELTGKVLAATHFFCDDRAALVTQPWCEDAVGFDSDDVLDCVRSVAGLEVVLFVKELSDRTCKLSSRSKEWYSVQRLCHDFGGGGHARAAGASFDCSLKDACSRLVAAVEEEFQAHDGGSA
jgi:phosphoesterase RecJ-like protein